MSVSGRFWMTDIVEMRKVYQRPSSTRSTLSAAAADSAQVLLTVISNAGHLQIQTRGVTHRARREGKARLRWTFWFLVYDNGTWVCQQGRDAGADRGRWSGGTWRAMFIDVVRKELARQQWLGNLPARYCRKLGLCGSMPVSRIPLAARPTTPQARNSLQVVMSPAIPVLCLGSFTSWGDNLAQ